MTRIAWLPAVLAAIGCAGSTPAPEAPPPCNAGNEATIVEARMLHGQGYLHRARDRAREAAAHCADDETTALVAAIERDLDPGTATAAALVGEVRAHRRAGRGVEARRAAARALAAAEQGGRVVAVVAGDLVAARSVGFADEGRALLVGLADGRALRFDLADRNAAPRPAPAPPQQTSASSADERLQARAAGAAITLSGDRRLTGHPGPVTAVAVSPDGLLVASAGADGVRLWDATLAAPMAHLAFGTGETWLVTGASGRADGSAPERGGPALLRWRAGDLELPGFVGWQREYHRGLLADLARRRLPF